MKRSACNEFPSNLKVSKIADGRTVACVLPPGFSKYSLSTGSIPPYPRPGHCDTTQISVETIQLYTPHPPSSKKMGV